MEGLQLVRLIEQRHPNIHLDSCRRNFIRDVELTLTPLVKELECRGSFCRLLLGRKGTGKTTLLNAIQEVIPLVYNSSVVVCYVNYMCFIAKQHKLPSVLIAQSTGNNGPFPGNILELEIYLREKKKYALLLVDELDSIYRSKNRFGREILDQLVTIGNSKARRIYSVITGSSYHLRKLCLGTISDEELVMFLNYNNSAVTFCSISLVWIHSFLNEVDFSEATSKITGVADESDLNLDPVEVFIETGGNPKLMVEKLSRKTVDSYIVSLPSGLHDNELDVLKAMYSDVHKSLPSDAENSKLDSLMSWVRYVPLQKPTDETIYNLADRGLLCIGDCEKVCLGSPLIYLEIAYKVNCCLTGEEATALLIPENRWSNLAEQTAMRFLASKAKLWLGFQLSSDDYKPLNITQMDQYTDLVNQLWKEVPDSFGADGVVFQQDNNGKGLVAYRIQLKLGMSKIGKEEANKIATRFKRMEQTYKKHFIDNQLTLSSVHLYLVTTRECDEAALSVFQNDSIDVIDRNFLADKIWPIFVKSLGKPYNAHL